MMLELVAVYDKRAAEYSPPQAYVTLGVAERAFQDAVNDTNSNLHRHPEDYNLQHIGAYDSENASIEQRAGTPHVIVEAMQFINK